MKPTISHSNVYNSSIVTQKRIKVMSRLATLLCMVMLATTSHSATRVFYDGSEAGNTNLWSQDGYRDRCTSVTSSADGITGPFAGSRMIRCNTNGTVAWNDSKWFENLVIDSFPYTNEFLFRMRVRIDQNHARSGGSTKKIMRWFTGSIDYFNSILTSSGLKNEGPITSGSYWGSAGGDNTASSSKWGKVEVYYNSSTKRLKQWHDGVLIRDETTGSLGKWYPFYLTSNYEQVPTNNSTNYVYFDEIEIYSDSSSGSPATGSMENATITASGSSTPTPLSSPQNLLIISPN